LRILYGQPLQSSTSRQPETRIMMASTTRRRLTPPRLTMHQWCLDVIRLRQAMCRLARLRIRVRTQIHIRQICEIAPRLSLYGDSELLSHLRLVHLLFVRRLGCTQAHTSQQSIEFQKKMHMKQYYLSDIPLVCLFSKRAWLLTPTLPNKKISN
jgi:hypothetical protein